MDYSKFTWVDDDLKMFQDLCHKFIQNEIVPQEMKWAEQNHVDREIWNKFGEVGMLCPSIPEVYGGGGGSFAYDAIIAFEMMGALAVGPGLNVHSSIVANYLLAFGTEEQKKKWLPKMASGEMVGAIAMSEPGIGSDLKNVKTSAVKKEGNWVINGSKTFITNGYLANLICVVCKTDTNAGHKGVSLIMVETDDCPGFQRGKILDKIGLKGQDTSELFFDNVVVPEENLLGQENRGFYHLMNQLPKERMLIALGGLATMDRAVNDTITYTKEREVFGDALFNMQNTRFKLAECKTKLEIAYNFVNSCMEEVLKDELSNEKAAMAKWWVSDTAGQVIDECLQLHGGYGFITEYPIARLYVNSRVSRIYGGSNEIMKEIISRSL